MVTKGLARHVHHLLKNISSLTLNQARISEWDPDNMCRLVVELCPSEGYYEGAKFNFVLILAETFPEVPPTVFCETPIYHPNIDTTDEDENGYTVCLSMFEDDEWSNKMGLDECIIGLLYLLYNPNLNDPLSPWFSSAIQEEDFKENVQKSLEGKTVDGFQFQENQETVCRTAEDDPVAKELLHVLNDINIHDDMESNVFIGVVNKNDDVVDYPVSKTDSLDENRVISTNEHSVLKDTSVILINIDKESASVVKTILDVFDMKTFSSQMSESEISNKEFCVDLLLDNVISDVQPCSLLKPLYPPTHGQFTVTKDCWDERLSYVCALSSGSSNDHTLSTNAQNDVQNENSDTNITKTRTGVSASVIACGCPVNWQQIHCNVCSDKDIAQYSNSQFRRHVNMDWLHLLLNSVYDSSSPSSSNQGNYFW